MYRTLISTDALASHLSDAASDFATVGSLRDPTSSAAWRFATRIAMSDKWAIIDCRYDLANTTWGEEQYRAGHIPGAVYASLSHDLAGPPQPGNGGRHPLPSPDAMSGTFGRWGITPATQVVCYDQDSGMYAARLWWMLRYMGHDAVALVDGGFAKWSKEGRPTRTGDERRAPVTFSGAPRQDMRQTIDQVRSGSALLVDARSPERYEGKNEPLDRVPGHIPGARNYFFKQNVTSEGTMLPPEQLREQLSTVLAGTPPDGATMYCGSGVTACHNLLALEHAGMPGAKLYVGSWSEWSSDPARPVATGPEPNHEDTKARRS